MSWELGSLDTFEGLTVWDNAPDIAFVISITTDEGVERCSGHIRDAVDMILMHKLELALRIILNDSILLKDLPIHILLVIFSKV